MTKTYEQVSDEVNEFVLAAQQKAFDPLCSHAHALGALQAKATEWLYELECLKSKTNESEMDQLHRRLAGKEL